MHGRLRGLPDEEVWLAALLQGAWLCFPHARFPGWPPHPAAVYRRAGDPNSSPHSWVASLLPPESARQPPEFI